MKTKSLKNGLFSASLFLAFTSWSAIATAEEGRWWDGAQNAADSTPSLGDSTSEWLELQRSGEQASDTPSRISGDVAARSYERYLKSFDREIPSQFRNVGAAD